DVVVPKLLQALPSAAGKSFSRLAPLDDLKDAGVPTLKLAARALRDTAAGRDITFTALPPAWDTAIWPMRHPLDYLGRNGGGGLGSNPSIAIGAAIALRDRGSKRLATAVLGDGDFLFGATALWTAAHYRVPVLMVVINNR